MAYNNINVEECIFIIIPEDEKESYIKEFCYQLKQFILPTESETVEMGEKSEISNAGNHLDEQDKTSDIPTFVTDASDINTPLGFMDALYHILMDLPAPYTIVQEHYHIDRTFRDSYYRYFSSQHFETKRYSRRLSFFKGDINEDQFFDTDNYRVVSLSDTELLKEHSANNAIVFMGSVVINPLLQGIIGRTLLHPGCLMKDASYMRLSEFDIHVYGRLLRTKAFPYRMQDGETMRCAEVTVLNIVEYYSNHYPEYRAALPSELLAEEERFSYERVLPSKGMTYQILSKLLVGFGYSPRLYDLSKIESFKGSLLTKEIKLRRLLLYYMESGIPVAVNVSRGKGPDHSVVCIGHGSKNLDLFSTANKLKYTLNPLSDSSRSLINAADLYDKYVVIDDNEPVYHLRKFDQLSLFENMKANVLAVPLNKRMHVDAIDAEQQFFWILKDSQLGLNKWIPEGYLGEDEDIVIRIFMATSHSFKQYRAESLPSIQGRIIYTELPMPHFIWVCELFKIKEYMNDTSEEMISTKTPNAFAEIVLDATSLTTKNNPLKSLLMMHYPKKYAFRYPDNKQIGFDDEIQIYDELEEIGFPAFSHNLTKVLVQ